MNAATTIPGPEEGRADPPRSSRGWLGFSLCLLPALLEFHLVRRPPGQEAGAAFTGFACGLGALLLMRALLRRHFSGGIALAAILLVAGATFLPWYMVGEPLLPPARSICAAAAVVWLWDRERGHRDLGGHALLGLACGFATFVTWRNAILLILPAAEMLVAARRSASWPRFARYGAVLTASALVGVSFLPLVSRLLGGEWLLPDLAGLADSFRFGRPSVLETLFSSRHGLLSWTPVLWAGYLGFIPLMRRRPQFALPFLPPLVMLTYLNMCQREWWAGESFSNRHFDALLPLFAVGIAASLDAARAFLTRHPTVALPVFALPFIGWNLALVAQTDRGLIPRDDTVEFRQIVSNSWRVTADDWGSPNTWPASWLFAWRHDRPASQYDVLVGRYMLEEEDAPVGGIDFGASGDDAFLGDGWGRAEAAEGTTFRRVRRRARLFAPLRAAEALQLRLRVQAVEGPPSSVMVRINGRDAGIIEALAGEWNEAALVIPADFWRGELNEVGLDAGNREVRVDRAVFTRQAGRR